MQHLDTSQLPCAFFILCMQNKFYLRWVNSNNNFPVMVVVDICEVDIARERNFTPKISCLRIYLLTIFHLSWPQEVYVLRYS